METLRERTRGIVVFAPTPFVEEGGRTLVDVEGLERNMEFLVQAGIPVVVVCGGVGELWDLSAEEHQQVVETTARQAAGRMVVFAGVYGDAAASITRSQQAEEAGADGVLLFPDDEAVPTAEALVDYYTRVGQAIGIGMMPFRADELVDIPVLQRLAALPNVVALKEERERMDEFQEIVLALGDQLAIIGFGLRLTKAALELRGLAGGPCRSNPPRLSPGEREELAEALGRFTSVAV
jgi:4-hydroxy-tetrahydrodipicolinate synthase